VNPSYAEGAAAFERADFAAAERIFHSIVERDPRAHRAWIALAAIAIQAGDPDLAIERARRAVALERNNAEYLNRLGVAYGERGDFEASEQAFRRALKIKPAYAAAHHNLAKALQKQGKLAESLTEFERAYWLEPSRTELQSSLCGMYRLHGDPARALAVLRTAVGNALPHPLLVPQFADCIADVEGPQAAIAWLGRLIERQPDNQAAHYGLAVMLLSVGNWREGWTQHLWRPRVNTEQPPRLPARLGRERVVLRGEYGIGDVLFYLRFLPQLRARGATVALHCPPELRKLAPLVAPAIELAEPAGPHCTIWIADLPSVLQADTTAPAFPLHISDAQRAAARTRLTSCGPAPYLGITWRAGTALLRAREFGVDQRVLFKEVPPALLGQAIRGWPGTFISLQRGPTPDEMRALRMAVGNEVHDLSAANEDLCEALALLAVLDEYVAVSNTNVHLLAGIGGTARVLVTHPPEWRWMRREGPSDWFPGFAVYRQPSTMDWTEPLMRLRQDLLARGGARPNAGLGGGGNPLARRANQPPSAR
jgi:tetratricopeptide (TPR) repeat protein